MASSAYEVVVVGLGAMGSAALRHLALAGVRVAGLEQFSIGHDLGSSHGDTRIIRKAYFLHPDYVPLLHRSYTLWRDLEMATATDLLRQTGLLCVGQPGSPFIRGLEQTFAHHALPHEQLTPAEARQRFPAFAVPDDAAVYFDPEGGYLRPEECIRTQVADARRHGAAVYDNEALVRWTADGAGVRIETTKRTIRAGKLILTTGAWVAPEFAALGIPLEIRRKVLFWHRVNDPARFADHPVFIWKTPEGGDFYGFPCLDGATMKSAEDSGGQRVQSPLGIDREIRAEDEANLRAFLDRAFPGQVGEAERAKVCLYTLTTDKNFVLDFHPEHPQVILATCCSGHGFKLSITIGEALAKAARKGVFRKEVDFLRVRPLSGV